MPSHSILAVAAPHPEPTTVFMPAGIPGAQLPRDEDAGRTGCPALPRRASWSRPMAFFHGADERVPPTLPACVVGVRHFTSLGRRTPWVTGPLGSIDT